MAAPRIALSEQKRALREQALATRARFDPALGHALVGILLNGPCAPRAGQVVAGFWALPGEIDIGPLLHALVSRGNPVCLPQTPPRGQPLTFRAWSPGAPLQPGRFGTAHPSGPVLVPDVLLVPLLAFDRTGARLGYGGGYYDRTLAALPGRPAIGCAFAAQEVPSVPTEPTDIPLQAVATESGLILFS